jgi:hypothetical protein
MLLEKEHEPVLYSIMECAEVFTFLFFAVKSSDVRPGCIERGGLDGSVSRLWIRDQTPT